MLAKVTDFVQEAGALVLEAFHRRLPAAEKGRLDIVTEADHASSALLTARLREAFPQHGVLSEEAPLVGSSGQCWFIDPLDGTKNFAHGHPYFCVTVALVRDGQPILAVTYDPTRAETFTAERGGGAYCNGAPIHVSGIAALKYALITTGFPSGKRHRGIDPRPFYEMTGQAQAVRRTGATALDLAYVAAGRFDASWDWALEPWDIAAGILLVREAGGLCTDWSGAPAHLRSPGLLAANPPLHPILLPFLQPPG